MNRPPHPTSRTYFEIGYLPSIHPVYTHPTTSQTTTMNDRRGGIAIDPFPCSKGHEWKTQHLGARS